MMSLRTTRDWGIRYVARKSLNKHYAEYGVMTKLEIDKQNKRIHAELELKGETQPITVDVNGYEVLESAGKTRLVLRDVKISRDWLNTAFQQFPAAKNFEIPDILRMLL